MRLHKLTKGRPNVEVKDKFLSVRIPESVWEQLKQQAEKDSRTLAGQILHYIKEGLKV